MIAAAPAGNANDHLKAMRYVPNKAFGFGERLEYDVHYSFVKAGTAVFYVDKKSHTVSGRPTFKVTFQVKSNPDFAFIYKVQDTYVTWLDIDGIFPWQFIQRTREKNFKKDFKAIFDQHQHKAVTTEGTYDIPPFVHDVVSAFYFVRTQDLSNAKRGERIRLKNFFDRETHDLVVIVKGRERIEVKGGTYDCVVVEPKIEQGSPFGFDGKLELWLSNDERKIPVKVVTHIPIGTIEAELTHYRGTRGSVDARVR